MNIYSELISIWTNFTNFILIWHKTFWNDRWMMVNRHFIGNINECDLERSISPGKQVTPIKQGCTGDGVPSMSYRECTYLKAPIRSSADRCGFTRSIIAGSWSMLYLIRKTQTWQPRTVSLVTTIVVSYTSSINNNNAWFPY